MCSQLEMSSGDNETLAEEEKFPVKCEAEISDYFDDG